MHRNLLLYIWHHTRPQQAWVLAAVLVSLLPYFMSLDLPKRIINGPIQGKGFETATSTQNFLGFGVGTPWIGPEFRFAGFELDRIESLLALSSVFLLLVVVNNGFKFYINTYKGRLGERLLRRLRFGLFDRVLRFPPDRIKRANGAEVASMIKDEVEPLGSFTGDAFVQPAMLGGQAAVALGFIFVQSVALGLVAAFMIAVQMAVIPRMRRRLLELGRQRQITARHLAGKVNDVVDGMGTIHSYDTSNYERADVAERLGVIFKIRYDIYQWKFLVKFLNNFLAQVTPFMFYLIGGYSVLRGSLDVGQLVAVINAYKDLPGPLKELIDWDQARQDAQVKYEQVRDYFELENLVDPALQAVAASLPVHDASRLAAVQLAIEDESGTRVLSEADLKLDLNETVAFADTEGRGAEALGEALGRQVRPAAGKMILGTDDLLSLPEAVTGRYVTYVSSESYFFPGSIKENILYGLKHAPLKPAVYEGIDKDLRQWKISEARKASNPDFDLRADWLDLAGVTAFRDRAGLDQALLDVLSQVQLTEDILDFALHATLDSVAFPELAADVVGMRIALHDELRRLGRTNLIATFDQDAYNLEATVGENLVFGKTPAASGFYQNDAFYRAVESVGLLASFIDAALAIASNLVEIFKGIPHDHPLFAQIPALTADDIASYQEILQQLERRTSETLPPADKRKLVLLMLHYVEPRYRLGVLTHDLQRKIVEARAPFYERLPQELQRLIHPYDFNEFVPSATLEDNILFGKLSARRLNVRSDVRELARRILRERGYLKQLLQLGLEHEIGNGGRLLSLVQRQKLNVARALIRRSNFYVFNKPLLGVDRRVQEEIVSNVIRHLKVQDNNPTIVWVLSNVSHARLFDRVVLIDNGQIVNDGDFARVKERNALFDELTTG